MDLPSPALQGRPGDAQRRAASSPWRLGTYTSLMAGRAKASFIEPMLLLRQDVLPNDATRWLYQLKLDGYRAIAFKSGGVLQLHSRNNKDFSRTYPGDLRYAPNEIKTSSEHPVRETPTPPTDGRY